MKKKTNTIQNKPSSLHIHCNKYSTHSTFKFGGCNSHLAHLGSASSNQNSPETKTIIRFESSYNYMEIGPEQTANSISVHIEFAVPTLLFIVSGITSGCFGIAQTGRKWHKAIMPDYLSNLRSRCICTYSLHSAPRIKE